MPDFDVVLFSKYSFHNSCLGPIAKELEKLEINFWMTGKRYLVYDKFNETRKKFKIFVIADEWGNLFRDISETLITTGHSLVSKNTTLDPKNSDMDYIYCPSQFYKTEFLNREINPKKEIIITGYPASSKIFRREMNLHSIWSKKITSSKIKVLFAPTYNKDLSLMDAIMKEETNSELFLRMNSFSVAFKLHPILSKKYPKQAEFAKYLSERYSHVYYHDNSHEDISDAIIWSDITIGDCSGALFLSIAGGKPVIAYDNPNKKSSPYYDEAGPEWTLRDEYAYRIETENVMNLPNLIRRVLEDDYKKDQRTRIVNLLFEHQKDAEKIIANHIADLLTLK